jgi:hypothetical protein
MTEAEARRQARIERVRRRLADPDVADWPEPSDEQIRAVAALLPPVRPGSGTGQPRTGDSDAA